MRWAARQLPVLALAAGLMVPGAAVTQEREEAASPSDDDLELGVLVGGGFFHSGRPNDPEGALTFLHGSAFTGGGFLFGATLDYEIVPAFSIGVDALYSRASIAGFAESEGMRRDLEIAEHALRLAALAKLNIDVSPIQFQLGGGPELAVSVSTSITEVLVGIEPEPPILPSNEVWVLLVGHASVALDVGPVQIPLVFRIGWNPGYPDTTAERFEAFEGPDNPGPLSVGYDWYVSGLLGARFEL